MGGSSLASTKCRLLKELREGKTGAGVPLTDGVNGTRQKKEARLAEIEELLKLPPKEINSCWEASLARCPWEIG